MYLKVIFVLLLAIMLIKYSAQNQNITHSEEIEMLIDFLKIQNKERKFVTAFLCYPKEDQSTLWKTFFKLNFPITIIKHFQGFNFNQINPQIFILDLTCAGAEDILNKASDLNLINKEFNQWILLKGMVPNMYFGVSSKIFHISDEGLVKTFYKVGKSRQNFEVTTIADGRANFSDYKQLIIPENRSNLMQEEIPVVYIVTNPDTYNHFFDYRHKEIDTITKLNIAIVYHLIHYINCTSRNIYRTTWGYSGNASNANATPGLVDDLFYGRAEIGGTGSFFTAERIMKLDYIHATAATYMKFIFRAPPLTYVQNVYTLPFQSYVWYTCFVMSFVMVILIYLIVKWEWIDEIFKDHLKDKDKALRSNFLEVAMMEIGAITQQGYEFEPQSNAGRITTFFALLVLMFLYNAYSANIVALLQSTTDSINSLKDLQKFRINLGAEDIVYQYYYFKTEKEPLRKMIYEQKIAPKGQKPNFMTAEEGIQRVRKEFFAFHIELSHGYKLVDDTYEESEKCGLKELPFFSIYFPSITCKKNSTYAEVFKVGLKRIQESGIQSREIRRLYMKKPVCQHRGNNFDSVGLIDCYAAFLIFGIGVGLSVMLMIFEIALKKFMDNCGSRKY